MKKPRTNKKTKNISKRAIKRQNQNKNTKTPTKSTFRKPGIITASVGLGIIILTTVLAILEAALTEPLGPNIGLGLIGLLGMIIMQAGLVLYSLTLRRMWMKVAGVLLSISIVFFAQILILFIVSFIDFILNV